jgi:hypothetical protein
VEGGLATRQGQPYISVVGGDGLALTGQINVPCYGNGECDNQMTADEITLTKNFRVDRTNILLFYQVYPPKFFTLCRLDSFEEASFSQFPV